MCIRDRHLTPPEHTTAAGPYDRWPLGRGFERYYGFLGGETCLLYTSDAADERSSVDLGGRRIIKKKTYYDP